MSFMPNISFWSLIWGSPSRLLKKATTQHNRGRTDKAIKTLRKAFRAIAHSSECYSVETFLRLPLYLQKAGRIDEAMAEFEKLLESGYPNQVSDASVRMLEQAAIYDKMRLALEREGTVSTSVAYTICSKLAEMGGLCSQCRIDELLGLCTDDATEGIVDKLLPNGSTRAQRMEITALVLKHRAFLPAIDRGELVQESKRILGAY